METAHTHMPRTDRHNCHQLATAPTGTHTRTPPSLATAAAPTPLPFGASRQASSPHTQHHQTPTPPNPGSHLSEDTAMSNACSLPASSTDRAMSASSASVMPAAMIVGGGSGGRLSGGRLVHGPQAQCCMLVPVGGGVVSMRHCPICAAARPAELSSPYCSTRRCQTRWRSILAHSCPTQATPHHTTATVPISLRTAPQRTTAHHTK
jgi:hypothetical protein